MYIVTDCPWILTLGMDSVILKSQIGKEDDMLYSKLFTSFNASIPVYMSGLGAR